MQGGVCVCAARRRCQPCLRPPPRRQPSGQGRSRAGSGAAPAAGSPPPVSVPGSRWPRSHLLPGRPRRTAGVRSAHSGSISAECGWLPAVAHRAEGSAVPQPRQPIILPLLPKANEAFTRRKQLLLRRKLESPLHPVMQGLFTRCCTRVALGL